MISAHDLKMIEAPLLALFDSIPTLHIILCLKPILSLIAYSFELHKIFP